MSTSNVIGANEAIPVPDLAGASFGEPACEWTFVFVWLFTFAIYARPEDILPSLGELHLTFALGLCAGLAYFLALGSGGTRISWSPQLQIVSLLTIWFFVGVPFAYWKGGSLHQLVHPWLKTFFIFFLLTQVLVTADRIQKLLWAIILSELLVTAYSIVESSKVMWVGDRMLGVSLGILGWNFLGIAAASTIPYMAALFVLRKSFLRTTLLIATVCSLMWMLVLTASRGGILNVLVSIALSFLLVLRGSARGKMVGVATVLALMVSVSLAPTVFWERVGTLWNSSELQANMTAASARESTEDRLVALEAVLAHEIGHYKKRHVPKMLAGSGAALLLGFFLLADPGAAGVALSSVRVLAWKHCPGAAALHRTDHYYIAQFDQDNQNDCCKRCGTRSDGTCNIGQRPIVQFRGYLRPLDVRVLPLLLDRHCSGTSAESSCQRGTGNNRLDTRI